MVQPLRLPLFSPVQLRVWPHMNPSESLLRSVAVTTGMPSKARTGCWVVAQPLSPLLGSRRMTLSVPIPEFGMPPTPRVPECGGPSMPPTPVPGGPAGPWPPLDAQQPDVQGCDGSAGTGISSTLSPEK